MSQRVPWYLKNFLMDVKGPLSYIVDSMAVWWLDLIKIYTPCAVTWPRWIKRILKNRTCAHKHDLVIGVAQLMETVHQQIRLFCYLLHLILSAPTIRIANIEFILPGSATLWHQLMYKHMFNGIYSCITNSVILLLFMTLKWVLYLSQVLCTSIFSRRSCELWL